MNTNEEKIKVSVSEITQILKWPYTTVKSIIERESPADKLLIIKKCEEKVRESKKQLQDQFQNQEN